MSPAKYRKKPVEIWAYQFIGDNIDDVEQWIAAGGGETAPDRTWDVIHIKTLEGTMRADVGDWIIKGVQGEFYPCKPDIFASTYEAVEP